MTIQVTTTYVMQNAIANAYATNAPYGMLFNTITPVNTGAATGEVASATYARQSLSWGTAANGVASLSSNAVFSMTSGDVVGAFGVCGSVTKTTADVRDWKAFGATQTFNSNGTFTVSASVTAA